MNNIKDIKQIHQNQTLDDFILSFSYDTETLYFNYIKNDHISMFWNHKVFYEDRLLEKIKSLNLNGLYVDVGSHHGNHSIFFDKFCSSDKVISIEGNPFNFNYLKKNITQNRCKNILYNTIISDKVSETLTMQYSLSNTGGSFVIKSEIDFEIGISDTKNIISNTTNTLDNLLKKEENITLIKLDIENYEYYALLGGQNIITKYKPIIVIELHKTNPYYNEIINFLNKNNYKTDGINYACSPTFIYKATS